MNRRWNRLSQGCILAACSGLALAQAGVSEYAVKAALLFKLPAFVYRNAAQKLPEFHMCVLGSSPFGSALEKLAQTPVDGRPVKLLRPASAAQAQDCEFAFIARSEEPRLGATLAALSRWPVVTVSDLDGFAQAGGMVELAVAETGAVALLVNRRPAQRMGIEFNAQLLRLATVVEP